MLRLSRQYGGGASADSSMRSSADGVLEGFERHLGFVSSLQRLYAYVLIALLHPACVLVFLFSHSAARKSRPVLYAASWKVLAHETDSKHLQIPEPTYGIISIICAVFPAGSQDRKERKQQIVWTPEPTTVPCDSTRVLRQRRRRRRAHEHASGKFHPCFWTMKRPRLPICLVKPNKLSISWPHWLASIEMQPSRRAIPKEELRLPAQASLRTNFSHSSDHHHHHHGSRNSPPHTASSPRVLNWTIARSPSDEGLPLRVYSGTLKCGDLCLSIAAAGMSFYDDFRFKIVYTCCIRKISYVQFQRGCVRMRVSWKCMTIQTQAHCVLHFVHLLNVCIHVHTNARVHLSMCTNIYMLTSFWTPCVCVFVCMCVHVCVYIYTYIPTYIHTTEGVGIIEDVCGEIFYAPEAVTNQNARDFKGRIVVIDSVMSMYVCVCIYIHVIHTHKPKCARFQRAESSLSTR